MRPTVLAALAALSLTAGCGPKAPAAPAAAPQAEAASPLRGAPEFAGCEWETVRGARLSIQGFACGPEHGNVRIVADDALPGFVLESAGTDGPVRSVAVRAFAKAADAPLDSILPAVRAASPGPYTAACVFAPAAGLDNAGHDRFVLEPSGEAKAKWEASVMSDTPMEKPCGDLGVSIAGDRWFEELASAPGTVVFVEMGSEIQIFDPATLRPAG
jgi:hypothetical protein